MKSESNDAEWHLDHPGTRKWMIQCTGCRRWGYRPDAPRQFFGRPLLEKYFEELQLNANGVCQQCRNAAQASPQVE
jgi:hypothetical protein